MRTLVVGAGATGGYFGGLLAGAGRDVTFLVRPARAEVLAAKGLRIATLDGGELVVEPTLATPGGIDGPYDVVLVSVKAYGLAPAMADFAPAVGPDTMVLPVLNGMRHVDDLVARFGERAVLGGLCVVATQLDEEGRIVQLGPAQELVYGDRHDPTAPRIEALHAEMSGAGFTARASREIVRDMWRKWVFLASLAAVTCLMRGSVGEVEAAPGGRTFEEAVVAECAAVAEAAGEPVGQDSLSATLATVTQPGSPATSSMFRDLRRGAPVEADHIIGDLVARAARLGVATPLLSLTNTSLAVYEATRPRA